MGKGTDKLYITHSEWSSDAAYSASAGSNVSINNRSDVSFKRLPFNFCAVSLQPFTTPVCTQDGTVFDIDHILSWLLKHGTNPVTGENLTVDSLINLNFAKNEEGDYVDPVTYKVLTDNTHVVAIRGSGNVFAYDTVERLNIKAKSLIDLVSGDTFTRKDVITLQDPHNLESRNLSSFKYIKEGASTLTPEQERERNAGVNTAALGSAGAMIKSSAPSEPAKPTVGKYLAQAQSKAPGSKRSNGSATAKSSNGPKAQHTTGRAAASLTSTGFTPHTATTLASLPAETPLLKPRKIKDNGYATLNTSHGSLTLELQPYYSPKAVWNFVTLSKRGFYNSCTFHRNIPNFMIQGGDPSGSGRGGESCWGKDKPFEDEWANAPLKAFDTRGMLAMANKGKNTNTSQFFVTYRAAPHLNRKHTIFGRVVLGEGDEGGGNEATLERMERLGDKDGKSTEEIEIETVNVFVDPFEKFLEGEAEKGREQEVNEEDENVTWTGKRIRGEAGGVDVGKYLDSGKGQEVVEEWEAAAEEPVRKKAKAGGGGFGNFDSW